MSYGVGLLRLLRRSSPAPMAAARMAAAIPRTSGALSLLGGGTWVGAGAVAAVGAADGEAVDGVAVGAAEDVGAPAPAAVWTVKLYFPSMGCPSDDTVRHRTV